MFGLTKPTCGKTKVFFVEAWIYFDITRHSFKESSLTILPQNHDWLKVVKRERRNNIIVCRAIQINSSSSKDNLSRFYVISRIELDLRAICQCHVIPVFLLLHWKRESNSHWQAGSGLHSHLISFPNRKPRPVKWTRSACFTDASFGASSIVKRRWKLPESYENT